MLRYFIDAYFCKVHIVYYICPVNVCTNFWRSIVTQLTNLENVQNGMF